MTDEVKTSQEVAVTEPTPPPTRRGIRAGSAVQAIVPSTIEEAFRISEAICLSGTFPESYKGKTDRETASKVMVGIMKGAEVGLPPLSALANIYIVNGRPSVWGDGALAIVQSHPDFCGMTEVFSGTVGESDWTASCTIKRRIDGKVVSFSGKFSWADAKTANLISKNIWKLYPQRMMKMRARAWAIRDAFSDALSGLSIKEEVDDIPVKQDVPTDFLREDTRPSLPKPETDQEDAAAQIKLKIGECKRADEVAIVLNDHAEQITNLAHKNPKAFETLMETANKHRTQLIMQEEGHVEKN